MTVPTQDLTVDDRVAHRSATTSADGAEDRSAQTLPQGVPARILVVDDDPVQRQKLSFAARNLGYDVEEATGGEDGLAKLSEGGVDLAFLDIRMPD